MKKLTIAAILYRGASFLKLKLMLRRFLVEYSEGRHRVTCIQTIPQQVVRVYFKTAV